MLLGTRLHPYKVFPDIDAIVRYVQRAEELGYDYITVPHHTIYPSEQEQTLSPIWWDPIVMATYLAAKTTKMRFLTSVLVLPQYNPIELAKQLASADAASGGRLGIGVGVGWSKEEYGFLGADWSGRGKRMDEYIQILRAIWYNDPASFEGQYYSFTDASLKPKPVQQPNLPIYVGGGDKAVERAARLGDGYMPISAEFGHFRSNVERLHARLAELGREPKGFPIIRHIPMFELAPWINQHLNNAGGHREEPFAGDYPRALEHVQLCESFGVTHLTALFMTDYDQMLVEIERFAEEIIGPVKHGC